MRARRRAIGVVMPRDATNSARMMPIEKTTPIIASDVRIVELVLSVRSSLPLTTPLVSLSRKAAMSLAVGRMEASAFSISAAASALRSARPNSTALSVIATISWDFARKPSMVCASSGNAAFTLLRRITSSLLLSV